MVGQLALATVVGALSILLIAGGLRERPFLGGTWMKCTWPRGMGSKPAFAAVIVAISVLVSACGSAVRAPDRTSHDADTSTSIQAQRATSVRTVRPFSNQGVGLRLHLSPARGSCWTTSEALPARTDAWRCMQGNEIMDPCFSAAGSDYAICLRDPWDTSGVKLQLTQPLPAISRSASVAPEEPWAFELVDGQRCSFVGGGTDTIGSLRLNYGCNGGDVYGRTDRTHRAWRVFFKRAGSRTLTRVEVRTAWL